MIHVKPATRQPYVILVALSFDQTGELALREAARLAELHPASELHVVHVVPEVGPVYASRERRSLERRLARAPAEIRSYVQHVWPELSCKVIAHLRVGVPAHAILRTAEDIHAEVVVVGTHRRSGMKKLMLGSVAEQVMHEAHCPVFFAMPKAYAPRPPAPLRLDTITRGRRRKPSGSPHRVHY
ncbi:MAG: universal stress protein [Polyangiales bacterium]